MQLERVVEIVEVLRIKVSLTNEQAIALYTLFKGLPEEVVAGLVSEEQHKQLSQMNAELNSFLSINGVV